ncbi:MAG TPA: peptide chain release factor 1 [Bacillota bacterium]|nr:peptide chain release factor 1 [Bacillota bacterium]
MLSEFEARYEEVGRLLADPATIARQDEWRRLAREYRRLEEVVEAYAQYKEAVRRRDDTRQVGKETTDEELRALAEAELTDLEQECAAKESRLKELLVPRDPADDKNVIVEIRAGTGGDEAGLFAADLYRMYSRFAERHGWRVELLSSNPTGIGGFKEIIFMVQGHRAFSYLKHERGVHRVQRVPSTEASGRIHTSTATVAVLPEAEEVEVSIAPDELAIETFCASGPGGQHVNKTESAVRVTHLPTGLVVSCQDEKSQHKNKERAIKVLRARLLELATRQQDEEQARARRAQVGTAERSEKIRTYNFPDSRITDHRLKQTWHKVDAVLQGDLDPLIEALMAREEAERLARATAQG